MNFYLWNTMPNKVPVFQFQNSLDVIDCNSLFGCNRIYDCKLISYGNMNIKNIAEVDAVRKLTC